MISFFEKALKELVPDYPNWYTWVDFDAGQKAGNVDVLPEYKSLVTRPTNDQINAKATELKEDYDALQYQRDRAKAFDPIPEQLDQIFHSMDGWKARIKSVKDKYPKPT